MRIPPLTSDRALNQAKFIDILKYSHRTTVAQSVKPYLLLGVTSDKQFKILSMCMKDVS